MVKVTVPHWHWTSMFALAKLISGTIEREERGHLRFED
jgi:hypothetical protein